MGTRPTKAASNIYCRSRLEAAKVNDRLNSRAGAAELLGVSESSLADYELGNTKVVPVDKAKLPVKSVLQMPRNSAHILWKSPHTEEHGLNT